MKFLAVLGNPIMHSKSPRMHNNAIKILGLKGIYTRYCLNKDLNLREELFRLGFDAVNITAPFKEKAYEIADFKDEISSQIGSSNTLCLKNNKIYAYNTDGIGFLEAIKGFENIKKALILGAGGTALALAYVLKQKGIEVCIVNRNDRKFQYFNSYQTSLYKNLKDFYFDLVINSTSAGLIDESLPCDKNVLEKILINARFAFDVIYNKETPFYKLCKKYNLKVKNGFEMLLWQGVFAFEIFFELKNKREEIKNAMLQGLKF
ncbi:shikimate dehydrogenase [Campylobacter estrildidarum]|uniref:shikimate dehydrogenase (NADP(+)) n=1 Tax=Campylobacter estrildidarum TaxID=2510189 RepID=A0A4U7BIL3_9BACT|nr:shikimate dehydrogenase [Campylobacter estrildidarum]TKX31339.1 shikimate dehydrogenase [Campylobacter estrildidarum]